MHDRELARGVLDEPESDVREGWLVNDHGVVLLDHDGFQAAMAELGGRPVLVLVLPDVEP